MLRVGKCISYAKYGLQSPPDRPCLAQKLRSLLGSRELLYLAEPRAGFGVGCHYPGRGWELKLQRAAQDSSPGSEINPKQQEFHEHEPGVAFPGITLLCPCLPCPPTGFSVGPCPWGRRSHQAGEVQGSLVSASPAQPVRCGHCHAAHTAPAAPALPAAGIACTAHTAAGCQPAKGSSKTCARSQKPVIELFSSPTRHG